MAQKDVLLPAIPADVRCGTGCEGLDDVVGGGIPRGHFYLLEGEPGTGKTTLSLQFVSEGCRNGERVLYVTLSESAADLRAVARAHGIDLRNVQFLELKPSEQDLKPEGQYSVFHPAEIELNDRLQTIVNEVARHKPDRLVIDALSEVRMLAKDPLRYRRQVISLREHTPSECTVLLLDDRSSRHSDLELHSIVHGVIMLEKVHREYGKTRRRLEVSKLRGIAFREGYHDYIIRTGGLVVFPRLIAGEHVTDSDNETPATSGIHELDSLVGGGLDRGTSTLLIGPAGSGKTTIALRWLTAAAARGETAAAFIFEETVSTLIRRARGLGMDIPPLLKSERVRIEHLDPAEMSPGEFVEKVRKCVDGENARLVVIDSLNGFLQSMPGEQFLALHLHELLTYLNHKGVVTLMILAQAGLVGANVQTPADVSYLADNILVLRYFEAQGGNSTAATEVAVRARAPLGNVTLLERPLRAATLISAVRSSLSARQRQYEIRDHLEKRKLNEEALRSARDALETIVEERTAALRRLSAELLRVQDDERRRIARELHDSLGQYLAAAKINLDTLAFTSDGREECFSEIQHLIDRAISETRTLSHLLHPPLLDATGFASAASWYVEGFGKRSGMEASLRIPENMGRLSTRVETALFRIMQEALTNVHRHSGSHRVEVTLTVDESYAVLVIKDFGKGIPRETLEQFRQSGTNVGVGLAGIRERIKELGGSFTINSNSRGTELKAAIPISERALNLHSAITTSKIYSSLAN